MLLASDSKIPFGGLLLKSFLYFSVAALLAGCVTSGTQTKLNKVSLGMSKPEVLAVMGNPDSTAGQADTEFMLYQLTSGTDGGTAAACAGIGIISLGATYVSPKCRGGYENDYFVRLRAGRVDAYGRVGDFDSTKDPTMNVNKNVTIETR